jgi:hypothetical protein
LTDTQVSGTDGPKSEEGSGRLHRLIHGWSANVVQMLLALTQQLLLIPAFLQFWSSEMLAAWLALFAAGSLAPSIAFWPSSPASIATGARRTSTGA